MYFTSLNVVSPNVGRSVSLLGEAGLNKRDLAQFLALKYCTKAVNYFPLGNGGWEKRGGSTLKGDGSGSTGINMFIEFTDDIDLFAYGTSLKAITYSTGTITTIKTDFQTNNGFDGVLAGDYAFIVNGVDYLTRVYRQFTATNSYNTTVGQSNKLTYTGQTVNFTVGQVVTASGGGTATITADSDTGSSGTLTVTTLNGTAIAPGETLLDALGGNGTVATVNALVAGDEITGLTSAATGVVLEITGAGTATQTIVVGSVNGTFQSGEVITGNTTPLRALTTSAVTFATTAVTGAPIGSVVQLIDKSLYIGNIRGKPWRTQYSDEDTGSNPPFSSWSDGSGLTEGSQVDFRRAGEVRSINNLGPYTIIDHERGTVVTVKNVTNNGASFIKYDEFIDSRLDFGGERGAKTTEVGVWSVNEQGLHQRVSVGQTDVPYSDQKVEVTNILGPNYFSDIDFSNVDIAHYRARKCILVTCARSSATNNLILAYDYERKVLFEIKGLAISRFVVKENHIYGASVSDTKIYELFVGHSDGNLGIVTELEQELPMTPGFMHDILKFNVGGKLHDLSEIYITFDRYSRTGDFENSAKSYKWTSQNLGALAGGYTGAYSDEFGDEDEEANGTVYHYDGANVKLSRCLRATARFTSGDKYPHELHFFAADIKQKAPARTRTLTIV